MNEKKKTTRDIMAESAGKKPGEDSYNPLLDSDDQEEDLSQSSGGAALPDAKDLTLPLFGVLHSRKKPVTRGFVNNPLPSPVQDRVDNLSDLVHTIEEVSGPVEVNEAIEDSYGLGDSIENIVGGALGDEDELEGDRLEDLFLDDDSLIPEDSVESYDDAWHLSDDEEDEDPLDGFVIDEVLADAIDLNASDVHITPYDEVAFSILGEVHRQPKYGRISGDVTRRVQQSIINYQLQDNFIQALELDTSYTIRAERHRGRRTRLNIGMSEGDVIMVFRVISDTIPTPEQLGLEQELVSWADLPNGLVLINGPTGTGKTTLMASLIRRIQLERREKIVTVEKPVEFIYGSVGKALIHQREVPLDARSYHGALTSAMRQAPHRILVGEVRNQEEVDALLFAAESGHWTISTIHASSAPTAINRIKSLYSGAELSRILGSLSDNIRGMANQVLLRNPEHTSRFGVREILSIDEEVAGLIRVGDTDGIRKYQKERKITLEHQLARAVLAGKATAVEARSQAQFPLYFDEILKSESV